jgi:flagellar basal-body rod modification protein FlgD
MAISGVSNVSPAADFTGGAERVTKKTLGQEDFFRLLAVQYSSQDPLKPMEDTSFIAQMANFTALENSTQLSQAFARFTEEQVFSSAQNLLGRNVTLLDPTDTEVNGTVSSVFNDGDDTWITVNGNDYTVASVRRVDLPPAADSPATSESE